MTYDDISIEHPKIDFEVYGITLDYGGKSPELIHCRLQSLIKGEPYARTLGRAIFNNIYIKNLKWWEKIK